MHPVYLPPVYQDSVDHGRLILRDGSTTTLRAAGPGDKEPIRAFFKRLSPESRYRRFFSMAGPDERLLDLLVDPDPRHQLTLVASRTVEGASRIIAVGSYLATDASSAEVAMAVDDVLHGKGIGTLLLERLSLLAVRHGFVHFWATTHCDNKPMADIFRNAGFPFEESFEEGCLRFDFPVLPTQKFVERSEKLDRLFSVASLRPLFHPQSIAVVGASRDPESVGHHILEALVTNGFQGAVFPVNPAVTAV
ncbi:MAG TPA: GNAT family N-acetyltransferase, partial [Acidobacteriota bacterium]|nr:GNAT family N-acetyltransferase [Acidobacteriota bacterium]